MMVEDVVDLEGTIRKWGNSYGFVVPVDVARRAGLREGAVVKAHLEFVRDRNDARRLPRMRFRPLGIDQAMEDDTR